MEREVLLKAKEIDFQIHTIERDLIFINNAMGGDSEAVIVGAEKIEIDDHERKYILEYLKTRKQAKLEILRYEFASI